MKRLQIDKFKTLVGTSRNSLSLCAFSEINYPALINQIKSIKF